MIKLYTLGGRKGRNLLEKLQELKLDFTLINNIEQICKASIDSLPALEAEEQIFNYDQALNYLEAVSIDSDSIPVVEDFVDETNLVENVSTKKTRSKNYLDP